MENTSYIALSRQTALWRQLDVVSNNLANMNTNGYQAEQTLFSEYLMNTRDSHFRLPEKLAYTQDAGTYRDLTAGPLEHTGNPLDLAINGEGYFEVEDGAGPAYTRGGRFTLDAEGKVVTADGRPLMTDAGTPLIIAPNEGDVTISATGTVSTINGPVGKLRLVSFEDEQKMRRIGGGLFDSGGQQANPITEPRLEQGMIEKSNVNPVVEMTRMIQVQRSYEAANKLIESENDRQLNAYAVLSGTK
ncbi:flagellar basal-body rod protein FlgF [Rhodospirillum rubrum]|uniref:flagellar basal-body rod protein FlgF n=1 Tax=Rhodospirillum rubrum TaxID=1085 RepID=UPI0019033A95|nr:flagellar basal-body rod protein FlgF [Rhodospirillum rubrum]MBK1666234.1 flagellar basal-body rod protein FlgF [Rhodospirillum rubrum]MBK1677317.1 flagellar basal-body rod protein FlgF [Rhodospirillum rubrum]